LTESEKQIRITPYSTDRKDEIADLLNVALKAKLVGRRDADYWAWKHEDNPFGRSLMLLAEADGRLVGVRAFMRWLLQVNGRTISAAKPVDSVTHPDYQRQGVFKRLTLEACQVARQEGVELLFNTPNANSLPGYLKMGWRKAADMALSVRLLRPISAACGLAKWKLRKGEAPDASTFFREPPASASDVLANEAAGIDKLLDKRNRDGRLSTKVDAEFLRWRYGAHPHIRYFAESVKTEGRLDGVMFYRTNFRVGMREIMLDDVLVRDGALNTTQQLLRNLILGARANYVLTHGSQLKHLRHSWFHTIPRRRINLVANELSGSLSPSPFEAENWSLCLGDLEGL